ncbi:hypothetical protein I3760_13G156600 [Carya illinoinensis]|nr:hypothetical protein I3760_13G156600 [Carya illinoinensis]
MRVELLAGSSYYSFVQTWKDEKEILLLHIKVDLVVTLGGDGTVLWVPGILICPHSLSFRPLILPEHVTLRVQVPFNSRGHAWVGDALVCSMAP